MKTLVEVGLLRSFAAGWSPGCVRVFTPSDFCLQMVVDTTLSCNIRSCLGCNVDKSVISCHIQDVFEPSLTAEEEKGQTFHKFGLCLSVSDTEALFFLILPALPSYSCVSAAEVQVWQGYLHWVTHTQEMQQIPMKVPRSSSDCALKLHYIYHMFKKNPIISPLTLNG